MVSNLKIPKPPRPEGVRERLTQVRSTCNLCAQVLYNIPQNNLPPGSYHRRRIETALKRSIEQNVYLLDLVELLMNERYLDFWNAVMEGAKPIKNGPEWLSAGITLNPKVYDMYEPELPIPFTIQKTDKKILKSSAITYL